MATTSVIGFSGEGFDLSDYALRGATAELSPIEQSSVVRRDINGNAVSGSRPQFKKYRVRISCSDQESPGFAAISSESDGVWPGAQVTVTLPPELGSSDAIVLDCLVASPWTESFDEYEHQNTWSLELVER